MDTYSLKEFMDSMGKDRKLLEDLVFDKVKVSIKEGTKKILLFSIDAQGETTSFYLNRKEYGNFLDSYLKTCESAEEYETCSRIISLKKELSKG
jgi:hypothetical protein